MATTAGQRFVRRHDAARGTTSNTTAADISYDTAVLSEGGYSWSSPEVTVDEAGLYLAVYDVGQVRLASTRAVGTLVPSINATDQTRFRSTHRYLRNSGGDEGASIGMAILDLAASDDVKVRNPGVLTPTDSFGNYATLASFGGALQLIRLPANDFTHVERTVDAAECGVSNINATRPWVDSSGTWTKITYNSEVNDDDALYSGSGGDLTLAANTKYMVVWGFTAYSTDASRHTYVGRLSIDGNNVQTGSGYQRNTASQGPPICGMYLHETGGSAETLFLEATQESEGADAGTPQIADAYLQVIELPASAEWIHVDNGATDSMTTALASVIAAYDTPLSSTFRADGNSDLSLDSANDAVQNDSGGSLPVLAIGWHRWDRDSGGSGTRKMPWTAWDNGGSFVGYGVASAFSRGNQGSDDTFQAHYCSVATMDLADGADLSFTAGDAASSSNADMGIYASTNRHFLGVQVLNLNTLVAASGGVINEVTRTDSLSTTDSPDQLRLRDRESLDALEAFDSSVQLRQSVRRVLSLLSATDGAVATKIGTGAVSNVTKSEYVKVEDLMITALPLDHKSTATRIRNRQQADSATVTDFSDHQSLKTVSATLSDNLSVSDLLSRIVYAYRTSSDYAALEDAVVKFVTDNRTLVDALALLDSISATYTPGSGALVVRVLQDSITLSDTLLSSRLRSRSQQDTALVSDPSDVARYRNRLTADDLALVDSMIDTMSVNRTLAESLVLLDSTSVVYTPSGDITLRVLLDSLSVTDQAHSSRLRSRHQQDSAVVVDPTDKQRNRNRLNSESLEALDAAIASRLGQVYTSLSDTLQVSDLDSQVVTRVRTSLDSLNIADAATAIKEQRVLLLDSASVSDSIQTLRQRLRSILNTVNVIDRQIGSNPALGAVSTATRIRNRTDTSTISVLDSTSYFRVRCSQALSLLEALDSIDASYIPGDGNISNQTLTDTMEVDATLLYFALRHGLVLDNLIVTDSDQELRHRFRQLIDSLDVTDTLVQSGITVTSVSLSDQLQVSDALYSLRHRSRRIADSTEVSDEILKSAIALRYGLDSLVVSDLLSRQRLSGRLSADSIELLDQVTISIESNISSVVLLDLLTVTDSLQPSFASGLTEFKVYHRIESLDVDHSVESYLIKHSISRETS